MEIIDEKMKCYLKGLLDVDQNVQVEKPEEPGPGEGGVESTCQDELTIKDLSVRFEPKMLCDHLPIFGSAEEIIRINRDYPQYLRAVRDDDGEGCACGDSCRSRKSRSKKQKKEDK